MVVVREADLIERLNRRYRNARGNGGAIRYVGACHVRFGPLWPSAIADYLVMDTWGNYGLDVRRHPLLGFEIKVSRNDYLKEIKNLDKSAPFRSVCAEWYMVVSSPSIVRNDLPDGWGLMIPRGDGLACIRKPTKNLNPDPMPRGLVAGFLRATATQYSMWNKEGGDVAELPE